MCESETFVAAIGTLDFIIGTLNFIIGTLNFIIGTWNFKLETFLSVVREADIKGSQLKAPLNPSVLYDR